jgi:hypothetical protein
VYLTATNLGVYLIGRGLIDAESVVDGDFVIFEVGRRNRNFKVFRGNRPGLFVKQVSNTSSLEPIVTLQREATFYGRVRSWPETNPLTCLTPRLLDYNPGNCSLVVELVRDGESLSEYYLRLDRFPVETGELVGKSLGTYHSLPLETLIALSDPSIVSRQVPWALTLNPFSLAPLTQFPIVGPMMIAALQQHPLLLQCVLGLRYEYRFDSLIHGDMKWDNLVVADSHDDGRQPELRIADWELVDLGDASWDVAGIFSSFLAYALASQGMLGPTAFAADPRDRITQMRPAMRSFWTAYTDARQLGALAARQYLQRCLRFAAARLAYAVFEILYGSPRMTPAMLGMLQTGQNIVANPSRAAWDLLGL